MKREDWEDFLQRHGADIPEPSPDLSRRIVQAASLLPQASATEQNPSFREWIAAWLRPKGAFAMACLVIGGFLLGFWAHRTPGNTAASMDLASIYNDGEISWLTDSNSSY